MPTVAASSAKTEFKYLMNVPPTSMDALRVRQVGASLKLVECGARFDVFSQRDLMLASG